METKKHEGEDQLSKESHKLSKQLLLAKTIININNKFFHRCFYYLLLFSV